jgi:hypothetical protein
MADLRRVKVEWTTGAGGAGLSVFYSASADDATASLGTFFNAIKGGFVGAVTWTIPSTGDKIESTTGNLTGAWTGGTGASIAGSTSGAYAAGTGFLARWTTGVIRGHRKFQGRTFLVPISSGLYDSSGTIDNTNLATFQAAVTALAAANKLVLWGRPTTPGGSDGISSTILAGTAVDKVVSLRTRRS